MKKSVVNLFLLVFLTTFVSAGSCDLKASLINQDPYPAIQGEYVKLLFQLEGEGITHPECGKIYFELLESYPIQFDPGAVKILEVSSGTYTQNYNNFIMIPIRVRIDSEAVDGENTITARYGHDFFNNKSALFSTDFNVTLKNVRAKFEFFVENFDEETNTLTLDVLNIGKSDAESVVIEIPEQEKIVVKGGNAKILGSLDSNEDSSIEFEAIPTTGQIKLIVHYTDEAEIRRNIEAFFIYNSDNFENRKEAEEKRPISFYLSIGLTILILLILVRGKFRRKKKRIED